MEEDKIYYTNSISVEANIYDIKLKLKYNKMDDDKKIQTKDLCEVVMSPQHAKALIKTLEDAIENYESNFGEIILTPRNSEKDNNNEK